MASMEKIQEKIVEVLDKMTVSYDRVDVKKSDFGNQLLFDIISDDKALLIGRDGKHLTALNVVVKQLLREESLPDEIDADFTIDVAGYQRERVKKIQEEAKMLANRAISFKHDVEMQPMSSYERMIVHEALQNNPSVTTESTGTGKFRRVVIKVK